MSKKHKRRKGSAGGGSHEIATAALASRARDALDAHRWRDAVNAYKELLKRESRADWRIGLSNAYAGRAGELTAKGMLKEALVIWENRAALDPQAPMTSEHAALLVRLGRLDSVIVLLGRDDDGALPRAQRERLRVQLAARVLGGDVSLLGRLQPDDPVRRHAGPALSALAGYCERNDEAVRAALTEIPFRSPYRDWVQILKALLCQPTAPAQAKALLDRIDEASGFAPLKRAAALSLLPETEFLEAAGTAGSNELCVAAALRGWPPERVRIWQDLHRLGGDPSPRALVRLLHHHHKALGVEWVRRKSLSLVAQEGTGEAIQWLREAGGAHPDRFEQALLAAWTADPHRDPWLALEHWQRCAALLERRWHEDKDPDLALRIALLLRRGDADGDLLGPPAKPSRDPNDYDTIAAEQLEKSLDWDPDDRAIHLRLISYFRRGRQLKEARRLLERAQSRWPDDMALLEAAMDIALDAGAFKKAAGLARRILDIDPINTGVRRRLINAHLAHGRKQVAKARTDLARKELSAATAWARDEVTRERIALTMALLAITDGDNAGTAALREQIKGRGTGLADRLELMLAADGLGLWLGKVNSQLRLKQPKVRDRDDLAAVMARLRAALDEDQLLSAETAEALNATLRKAPWRELSRAELETACDTLQRHELDKARQQVATAALKRWRGAPVFELHRFEAKYPNGFDYRAMGDLRSLEAALERAHDEGDMRTAMRIEEALPVFGPRGGLGGGPSPFPPFPFPSAQASDDDAGVPEHVLEMIRVLGIKKALEVFGAPPEVIHTIEDIERVLGADAATKLLLQFLDSDARIDPFDDLPFPPQPRGRKRPRDDDDDDIPDQLDLF
jgi:hypothetical protein